MPKGLVARRQARAAAWVPPAPPSRRQRERAPRHSRSRAVMWVVACAACVLAITVASIYITREHPGGATATASATGGPVPGGTALPQPLPSASVPASLAGTWSGPVHQTRPLLSVTVQISLPAGSPAGTIAYPELGCSGSLAIVSVAAGKLTLDQIITTGKKNCPNGVISLARLPSGRLAFTFRRLSGVSPAGFLTRRA